MSAVIFALLLVATALGLERYSTVHSLDDVQGRLEVEDHLVEAGGPAVIHLVVRNSGPRWKMFLAAKLHLSKEFLPCAEHHITQDQAGLGHMVRFTTWLRPGQEADFSTALRLERRGRYVLEPMQVVGGDFLGLVEQSRTERGFHELIVPPRECALPELEEMLGGKFGKASSRVVIEEFLHGIEISVFAITDGKDYKILGSAKDYKRVGEGDTGLNTGGMGAVSPVPFADEEFNRKVEERIVRPTVEGLKKDGIDYRGFIFFGLMNKGGDPAVIEYNVRMGDPETEVVMPRLKTDILELFEATALGKLADSAFELDERYCTTVMLVAGGYPGSYEKGNVITGLDNIEGSIVFHAGTKEADGQILTNGGRVMAVSSFGTQMEQALKQSYANVARLSFKDMSYRRDIGQDLIEVKGKKLEAIS